MYETHYGFRELPFRLSPDPEFLYRSRRHEAALTFLEYGILSRAGFVVITGEAGTGKSTLLHHMLRSHSEELPVALLSQTSLSPEELLRALCVELSIPHEGKGKPELHEALGRFMVSEFRKGGHTTLILDEAQNLSVESLEEVRMLSNLYTGGEPLLQVILVGQASLLEKLRRPELRQLAQRVEVSYHLDPLDREDLGGYIRHRLKRAGGSEDLFDDSSLEAIYAHTRGIPRLINALCHSCLIYGMADDLSRIGQDVVEAVVREQPIWELVGQANPPSQKEESPSEPGLDCLLTAIETLRSTLESLSRALLRAADGESLKDLQRRLQAEMGRRAALGRRVAELERRMVEHGQELRVPQRGTSSLRRSG
jgi:general secretion pathway protein A